MDGHRTAELRSLAYHRAIADRIREEPRIVATATSRVTKWRATGEVHRSYAEQWAALLALPVAELAAALVEDSERMRALRQVSPFAGVLDARTRWKLWRSIA
jgi:hypothetical protein